MKKVWEKFKAYFGVIVGILVAILAMLGYNAVSKKKTNKVIVKGKDAIDDSKEQDIPRKEVKEKIKATKETNSEVIAKNKELLEKIKGKL